MTVRSLLLTLWFPLLLLSKSGFATETRPSTEELRQAVAPERSGTLHSAEGGQPPITGGLPLSTRDIKPSLLDDIELNPTWLERIARWLSGCNGGGSRGDAGEQHELPELPSVTVLMKTLFSLALIAVLVVGFGQPLLRLLARLRQRDAQEEDNELIAEARKIREDEVDRLVQAGDYARAVHALMLKGLLVVADRQERPIPRSWTSREIVALSTLDEASRSLIGELVRRAEPLYFSDRPATREEVQEAQYLLDQLSISAPSAERDA